MAELAQHDGLQALRGRGALALFRAGATAFRGVPGLRWLLVRGFLMLYACMAGIGALVYALVFKLAISPMMAKIAEYDAGEGFLNAVLSWLLSGLYFFTQAFVITACVVLAMVLSLTLMSVWFEALASRIIAYRRGEETSAEGGFSLGGWLGTLGRVLLENVRMLALALLALILGFVPVVGVFLVFLLTCYLLGYEVREPVLEVLGNQREHQEGKPGALRKGMLFWTIKAGLLPTAVALVPWFGWLALPTVMIYLVAGTAWLAVEPGLGGQSKHGAEA